jgi:hypothetical protein
MTIFFVFMLLNVLKWGSLFDKRRGVTSSDISCSAKE